MKNLRDQYIRVSNIHGDYISALDMSIYEYYFHEIYDQNIYSNCVITIDEYYFHEIYSKRL